MYYHTVPDFIICWAHLHSCHQLNISLPPHHYHHLSLVMSLVKLLITVINLSLLYSSLTAIKSTQVNHFHINCCSRIWSYSDHANEQKICSCAAHANHQQPEEDSVTLCKVCQLLQDSQTCHDPCCQPQLCFITHFIMILIVHQQFDYVCACAYNF